MRKLTKHDFYDTAYTGKSDYYIDIVDLSTNEEYQNYPILVIAHDEYPSKNTKHKKTDCFLFKIATGERCIPDESISNRFGISIDDKGFITPEGVLTAYHYYHMGGVESTNTYLLKIEDSNICVVDRTGIFVCNLYNLEGKVYDGIPKDVIDSFEFDVNRDRSLSLRDALKLVSYFLLYEKGDFVS